MQTVHLLYPVFYAMFGIKNIISFQNSVFKEKGNLHVVLWFELEWIYQLSVSNSNEQK